MKRVTLINVRDGVDTLSRSDYYEEADRHYEWNNGYLEEKPLSDYATILIYNWLVGLLGHYFESHPNGTMVNLEMGFRLNLAEKVTIRKPDLGVVCTSNPVQLSARDCSYHGTFDLCIEALSDTSKKAMQRDTQTKKQEYAEAGVKEYYIVYDKGCDSHKGIDFYQLKQGVYQPIKRATGDLIESTVLPGFQFRIEDLYRRPTIKAMSLDPIYQNFIFPEYQLEKNRADSAEQQAQSEKNRADDAEKKLIKLQEILAQQGFK